MLKKAFIYRGNHHLIKGIFDKRIAIELPLKIQEKSKEDSTEVFQAPGIKDIVELTKKLSINEIEELVQELIDKTIDSPEQQEK